MPFPTMEEIETRDMEIESVPEVGVEDVEVESEMRQSTEETLDVKPKNIIPPLRPLSIAPKPAKIPLTIKQPIAGQQLLLLPGTAGGQQLKLVTSQGGGLSLANLSLAKPIQIRTSAKVPTQNNISVLQPKQVIMRKIAAQPQKSLTEGKQGNIMVSTQKVESKTSQENLILSPTKTITLAQAQELGLLSCTKLIQTKPTIVVNKSPTKTVKLVTQGKPHAKILPAPLNVTKTPQRIILKPASTTNLNAGQILHVTDTQSMQTGQLHQINIPGKGIQYIKIVSLASSTPSENTSNTSTVASQKVTTQVVNIGNKLPILSTVSTTKTANLVLSENIVTTATTKTFKTNNLRPTAIQVPSTGQLVMLPAGYLSQSKVSIPPKITTPKTPTVETNASAAAPEINLESNGMRPRKPCNCNKSQCLKLYCDCFANGEFCHMCNCSNCFNNIESEEHRQRAIKSCLERNPHAFRPKIGKSKDMGDASIRKHTKGCNCKRSGCLKNYCECYEAKIACSSNCKCVGCRNIEDALDKKENMLKQNSNVVSPVGSPIATKFVSKNLLQIRPRRHSNSKHAFNFITDDVIEATSQCLLAISDTGESNAQDEELTKLQIIEEFGRCLTEIINCSNNKNVSVNAN